MTGDRTPFAALAELSPVLFLVAGGLLLVFAVNTAARVFAGAGTPAIHNAVGPTGFFVGLVGLIGLSPGLAGTRPRLASVVLAVAAVPLVGWFVIAVFGIGNVVGVLPDVSVVAPGGLVVVVFLTSMLAYLAFGGLSLRSGAFSEPVNFLLLTPAVPYLVLIAGLAVLAPTQGIEVALDTGHALAHLAVGAALLAETESTERAGTIEPTT